MMHLNPEDRFQTATEVRRALEPLAAKYSSGDIATSTGTAASRAGLGKTAAKATAAQENVKGTLMLAEASPQEQADLRGFFRKLGYKVLLTENLQRALDLCSATPRTADCLVISTQSLGEEAITAFNKLTTDPFYSQVPAILLIGQKQREIATQAVVDERRRVLVTPFHTRDLTSLLEAIMSDHA
jgi:response regulator RpfG family c-di-GMP phosphodiesterase